MARRRYQQGSVLLRGARRPAWVGRWREDVIEPGGQVRRICRKVVLGYKTDIPTKKLALRELESKLAEINSYGYQPTRVASFSQFVDIWRKQVLPMHRPSSQNSIESVLRTWLIPYFGPFALRDINSQSLQSFVHHCTRKARTVKSVILVMRMVWANAKFLGYVTHNPFDGLRLPKRQPVEAKYFTLDDMKRIIDAAREPFRTMFWLAAETGMRTGELRALQVSDICPGRVLVRKSVWRSHTTATKNSKERTFQISPGLERVLRVLVQDRGSKSDLPLVFQSSNGRGWDAATVSRFLYRVTDSLGIPRAGMHAFRHGNESLMDQLSVPMKVRQDRLGHAAGSKLTLNTYTHASSEDHRLAAERLGEMLSPVDKLCAHVEATIADTGHNSVQ